MSLICQLLQSFFGPVHSWRANILEEIFQLQLHLSMGYEEVKRLPIRYRRWFIERLCKHFKDRNEARERPQDANNDNIRALSDYQEMLDKKFK